MADGTVTTQADAPETGDGFGAPSHIIQRPRLTKILDETEARIILLCAPAGYGKTTLARQWVATRSEPVLWYSGGPAMADVAALAVDLAELFAGRESEVADRIRNLAARNEAPRILAKNIVPAAPRPPTMLVIDDYQFAGESSDADTLLHELIRESQFRLVLTSRVAPVWVDSRAVVYGSAKIIDQRHLAFTPEEARAVLPEGGAVLKQAHGWPAVIGLAATTRRTADEANIPVDPDRLYEFVANEVFAAAGPALQESLLVLGAGGDATRAIARELLGADYESTVKAAMARGFLVHGDEGWIAIHPLLRQFLLRCLSEIEARDRDAIVSRVYTCLKLNSRWEELLRLLSAFPRASLMSTAFEVALPELLGAGRIATLSQWVDTAASRGFQDPVFDLARAEIALRVGRNLDAMAIASTAASHLAGDLAARAHLVAARAAHQTDATEETARHASSAARLAVSYRLQTEAGWLALINSYEREPARVFEYFEQLKRVADPSPEHAFRVACAEAFMRIGEGGHAGSALEAAETAVVLASQFADPLLKTNALNIRAHLLRLCGEYERALEKARELRRVAEETGLDFVIDHALLTETGAFIGLRSVGLAREVLRKIEVRGRTNVEHIRRNAVMLAAKLKIVTGDIAGAALALDISEPSGRFTATGEYRALRALLAAALGDGEDAASRTRDALARSRYLEVVAYTEMAEAIVLSRAGQSSAAADRVQALIDIQMMDAVVTGCRAYQGLAADLVKNGHGQTLEQVLSRSHDVDLGRRAGLKMPRELRRGEGLTRREVEVYELLVEGRTNAEIARTLFISESTTKVHVRHIFEKLGVHSRAEAAAAKVELLGDD
jgi:ATP/maltotriose-dependent transcriptional regulator MalT